MYRVISVPFASVNPIFMPNGGVFAYNVLFSSQIVRSLETCKFWLCSATLHRKRHWCPFKQLPAPWFEKQFLITVTFLRSVRSQEVRVGRKFRLAWIPHYLFIRMRFQVNNQTGLWEIKQMIEVYIVLHHLLSRGSIVQDNKLFTRDLWLKKAKFQSLAPFSL